MDTSSPEFQAALRDHARSMGVDPDAEPELMVLVQEALLADVPEGWEQGETDDGTLYYFNTETEESIWEHPLDGHYRELIQAKKTELASTVVTAVEAAPSPTPSPVAATTVTAAKSQQQAAKEDASRVEVYSFDESDDDDDRAARHKQTKDTRTSSIASLFAQPAAAATTTTTSNVSSVTASKTDSFGSLGAAVNTATKQGGATASGGALGASTGADSFGRDRSWLLEAEDDDAVGALKATTASSKFGASGAATSSTGGASASSSMPSASTSASPYVSRMFSSSGTTGTALGAGMGSIASSFTATTALSSQDGSTSPTTGKISPRRGLASTIKGHIFQDISTGSTPSTTNPATTPMSHSATMASAGTTAAAATGGGTGNSLSREKEQQLTAKISELEKKASDVEKKNSELSNQVEQLARELDKTKQQLDQARTEAKEVNYHKMKANELKAKLAEKESETQKASNDQSAKTGKLQDQLQQLQKENDQLQKEKEQLQKQNEQLKASTQEHASTEAQAMEARKVIDRVESEKQALQKQLDELRLSLQRAQQTIANREKDIEERNTHLAQRDKELDGKNAQIKKLEATFEASKDQLERLERGLERERKEHESEVEALRDQITAVKQQAAEKERKGESLNVLQDTLDRQTRFIKDMEEKNKELQTKLGEAQSNEEEAKRQARTRERECEDLTRKQALLANDVALREKQVHELQNSLRLEQDALKELQGKAYSWQRQEEDFGRQKQSMEKERQDLLAQLRDKDDQRHAFQSQLQKQHDEHLTGMSKLQMELHEAAAQLKAMKMQEVAPLEKQRDQLQRENERLVDKITSLEKELRHVKQELMGESQKNHQFHEELEAWKRKEQQQRAQKDSFLQEKLMLDKQLSVLQADIAAFKHDKRLEAEKLTFRVRELESQVAQKDYEVVRVEEKFTKADAWRIKEARRVEERDVQVLELKEELAQLKSRNIDAENNVIIQELRREKEQLEHKMKQLEQELAEMNTTRQVHAQKYQDELGTMQKALEWQIPQLAAACVNRTSEEWVRKCHQVVKALREDFDMRALQERTELVSKIKAVEEEREHVEQKWKNATAECEFLRKEVHRVEDNNKVLLDQLHTIRVYMTQRSFAFPTPFGAAAPTSSNSNGFGMASPGPSAYHAPPPVVPAPVPPPFGSDFATINHLNTQLGILHAQFQQLFDASERKPPPVNTGYSPSERFEIPSSPPAPKRSSHLHRTTDAAGAAGAGNSAGAGGGSSGRTQLDTSSLVDRTMESVIDEALENRRNSADLHSEQEKLITTLEAIGLPQAKWMPVFSPSSVAPSSMTTSMMPTPSSTMNISLDPCTLWYQKDYWRAKYQ
ncbi:TPA: hypothetical protein N0F65_002778 [Lagenidium giganteum]|uniref:WW domain-containing protein n=1 Tax=Lagenidium giganteum TaxID=4803 RepID=A0AAV2YPL0_9STRA|nr:TPA: hypothetical protein N0F65_002778 [Lagenidium giganteum]